MSDNEHEERARASKAFRLVRFAELQGWHADDVESFGDNQWRITADLAGVNPPSDRTKAIVLHVLRERSNG